MIPIKIQLLIEEKVLIYRGYLKEKVDSRIIEYTDENLNIVQVCVKQDFITIARKNSIMTFKENYMSEFEYETDYGVIPMRLLSNKIKTKSNSFLIDYCLFDKGGSLVFNNKIEIKYTKE